jgi:hypothetical protein
MIDTEVSEELGAVSAEIWDVIYRLGFCLLWHKHKTSWARYGPTELEYDERFPLGVQLSTSHSF